MDEQSAHDSLQLEHTDITPQSTESLTYEETPVIEPVPQEPPQEISSPAEHSHDMHHSFGSTVRMIFLFLVLFAVGMGISVVLRQYLGSYFQQSPETELVKSTLVSTVTPTPNVVALLTPIATPTAIAALSSDLWKSYPVIGGATKQTIGMSFKLPPEILSPICDGASCASQGTYLPNGTRFTVAARGKGQLLADARGNIVVTDASGRAFMTKPTTVAGERKALEYTGLFSGTTVGGYTFSQMRGLMIEVDEDESLEMNHFIPSGVSADFAKDDALFDKIVASLTVATAR